MSTVTREQLQEFGAQLGRLFKGGEVLELIGVIGAGKTTLTQAVASGMGIAGPIQSPTYTISNNYTAPSGVRLAHYDFYRLSDAGIMADELHETLDDNQTVTVIEWGDIVTGVLPSDRLSIRITVVDETTRQLDYAAKGPKSQQLLQEVL